MKATDRDPLDYQLPSAQRRGLTARRHATVIVLAAAVGLAGKLCWDKFAQPIARHFVMLRDQRQFAGGIRATYLVDRVNARRTVVYDPTTPPESVAAAGRSVRTPSLQAVDEFESLAGFQTRSDYIWVGTLTNKNGNRLVMVRMIYGHGSNESSVFFVAQVYQPATLLHDAVVIGSPQWFAASTPTTKGSWGPADAQHDDGSVLVIPGTVDDRIETKRLRLSDLDEIVPSDEIITAAPQSQLVHSSTTGSN